MKHLPFSVFKRADRPYYLVSFKNEVTGKYIPPISTRQKTESEAIKTAIAWLQDGIPVRESRTDIKQYSLRDMAKDADLSKVDAVFICKELQRRGFLKSYVLAESQQAIDFENYLRSFWDYEHSAYVKEKLRKRHGIHRRYVIGQAGNVGKYWIPFFPGKILGEITWANVDAFISHLERLPLSPKWKNRIISAGAIPLKWAFHRGMIGADVSAGHTKFSGDAVKRPILTPELAAAVFRVPWNDERAMLANMLSMVTGMRAGEIQALRVQDLGKDCLYVRHSWNFMDGLKTTKNKDSRRVEVPFPFIIQKLIDLSSRNPHGANLESYVFWAELSLNKPMEAKIFLQDFRAALVETGMNKESAKAYVFHGWRHYFTSYMKGKVDDKVLQGMTGHKTIEMLEHYSDHELPEEKVKLRKAQKNVFGKLLPAVV